MKDAVLGALAFALVFYLLVGAAATLTWIVLDALGILNRDVLGHWRITVPLLYCLSYVVVAIAVRPRRPNP